jgi:phosphate transport system substrate-binding protein
MVRRPSFANFGFGALGGKPVVVGFAGVCYRLAASMRGCGGHYPATGAKSLKARPTVTFAGLIAAATLLAATAWPPAAATEISGAGATFPYPIFSRWADAYQKETGNVVNYYQIGSGAGIRHIRNGIVTFGASDMPLKPDQLNADGLVQFPSVIGGTAPVLNLEGITSGEITLDGATLAKIFLGEIGTWNDPAIAKLNPNVTLPSLPIVVVHRGDDSGTTFVWTDYLSKVSREWASRVGANTSVQWPAGIGANGHEGVVSTVRNTKGAIGYVEYSYARQSKLTTVSMINMEGKTVEPGPTAFQAAAGSAKWDKEHGFYLILTDQPGTASWPITSATFVFVHTEPKDPTAVGAALKFFAWAFTKGDKMAEEIGYVPLPKNVVAEIEKVWASEIKDASGKPLYALAP